MIWQFVFPISTHDGPSPAVKDLISRPCRNHSFALQSQRTGTIALHVFIVVLDASAPALPRASGRVSRLWSILGTRNDRLKLSRQSQKSNAKCVSMV